MGRSSLLLIATLLLIACTTAAAAPKEERLARGDTPQLAASCKEPVAPVVVLMHVDSLKLQAGETLVSPEPLALFDEHVAGPRRASPAFAELLVATDLRSRRTSRHPRRAPGTPTAGRIVHYWPNAECNEPYAAIVVRGWDPDMVNLMVFTDGTNGREHFDEASCRAGMAWRTSVHRSSAGERWAWPERDDANVTVTPPAQAAASP